MKPVIIIFSALFLNLNIIFAQPDTSSTIEVIGYAEMEIPPDYIVVSFKISEYNPEIKETISLTDQENELFKILEALNIDKKNLIFDNFGEDKKYRKRAIDTYKSNWYLLTLNDINKLMILNEQLYGLNLTSFSIDALKNTQIEKYKENLYKKAMENAVNKAKTILAVIDKNVGKPVEINENLSTYDYDPVKIDNTSRRVIVKQGFAGAHDITLGNIKLEYRLVVKFEII